MTEEEAKRKWCPFARQLVSIENNGNPLQVGSANRYTNGDMAACIASACMAWGEFVERRRFMPGEEGPSVEEMQQQGWEYKPLENTAAPENFIRKTGYCKLMDRR